MKVHNNEESFPRAVTVSEVFAVLIVLIYWDLVGHGEDLKYNSILDAVLWWFLESCLFIATLIHFHGFSAL